MEQHRPVSKEPVVLAPYTHTQSNKQTKETLTVMADLKFMIISSTVCLYFHLFIFLKPHLMLNSVSPLTDYFRFF